jgi:hypothetical protein
VRSWYASSGLGGSGVGGRHLEVDLLFFLAVCEEWTSSLCLFFGNEHIAEHLFVHDLRKIVTAEALQAVKMA